MPVLLAVGHSLPKLCGMARNRAGENGTGGSTPTPANLSTSHGNQCKVASRFEFS
jgi:hypothetical protein